MNWNYSTFNLLRLLLTEATPLEEDILHSIIIFYLLKEHTFITLTHCKAKSDFSNKGSRTTDPIVCPLTDLSNGYYSVTVKGKNANQNRNLGPSQHLLDVLITELPGHLSS